MRVLVCGSRGFRDGPMLKIVLDGFLFYRKRRQSLVIIHGDALKGADAMAKRWAKERDVAQTPYPANWDKYGLPAGRIRNKQMLIKGKPELVIAFYEREKTGGTSHMVSLAKGAEVRVWEMYSH